ncbi:unnamed protein product [Gulo gulo]|uniref:Plectin/eS10 N-terminal domain-containing protein n=1 Tax=Gulo gulo TaxID=48420 RepID=A0A9X9Q7D1_GULGU|nr:unnamed protein product [Gulo gulo]
MLVPKKNQFVTYELLFKEGVMVAKKDVHMPKCPERADKNVPNLHIMKTAASISRDYLHLPPGTAPATLRRSHPETGRPWPKGLEVERPARLTQGEADRPLDTKHCAPWCGQES